MIELTENPEALCNTSIAVTDFALYGCRLGDDATSIDQNLVTATLHHVWSDPSLLFPDAFRASPESFARRVASCSSPDSYHFMSEEQKIAYFSDLSLNRSVSVHEWLLSDRIKHVIEFGGKLITGISINPESGYRVKDGRIVMIDLDARKVPFLKQQSELSCRNLFGIPAYYDDEPDDEYAEFPKIEIGYSRGIYLRYDKWSEGIDRVTLYFRQLPYSVR